MNQKGEGLLGLLIVIAIIGLLAYGGYSFWQKSAKVDVNNTQQVENKINKNKGMMTLYFMSFLI